MVIGTLPFECIILFKIAPGEKKYRELCLGVPQIQSVHFGPFLLSAPLFINSYQQPMGYQLSQYKTVQNRTTGKKDRELCLGVTQI